MEHSNKINTVSKENPLSHYKWGENCDGWNLLNNAEASVKQELMPKHTSEQLHFHQYAAQFFFILKGKAEFLLDDEVMVVNEGCGLKIKPGCKHKIMNNTEGDLEFILFSYPSTINDRTNCE